MDLSGFTASDIFVNSNDPDGVDDILGTADDGLVPAPGSPLMDAGTNTPNNVAIANDATDIAGQLRIFNNTVDIGAYEGQVLPFPMFENNTPNITNIIPTGFDLQTDIDIAGNVFYVVIPDGATAPTSEQVIAGVNYATVTVAASGTATAAVPDFTNSFTIRGLATNTAFDVYVVAEDTRTPSNIQPEPTLVEVTTLEAVVLTVTGLTGNDKVYDGTVTATVSGTGVLNGINANFNDVRLSANPTFVFSDDNVGTGIAITSTDIALEGADAANYVLTPPSLSADITPADLTIAVTANDKECDATTVATVSTATFIGLVTGDDVQIDGEPTAFNFAQATPGTDIAVIITGAYTITGADASNYNLIQPTGLTADITDTTAPEVFTRDITIALDANGQATISVDDIDDGSIDNCGIASRSLNVTSFNCPVLNTPVTVTLTVTDINGNSASETAEVTFTGPDEDLDNIADPCDDDFNPSFEVVQGISPNGDGQNDTWVINRIQEFPTAIVQVFDRNGVEVFRSQNYQNDWNGSRNGNGSLLPVGSYYYNITFTGQTGVSNTNGWIYINY